MKSRIKSIGALAASVLLLPLFVAQPASATTAKCSPKISAEAAKIQTLFVKAFQKCDGFYRKGATTANAAACQGQLATAFANGAKEKGNLDKLVPKTCTDVDLLLLGHLPTGTFGDLWSRYVEITALDQAYQQQVDAVRDTPNMFQDLSCAPAVAGTTDCSPGHATSCANCEAMTHAPCYSHSCTYPKGLSGFDDLTSGVGDIPGDLIGSTDFRMCQFPGISPANEYLVTGMASKGIQPTVITGLGFACPVQLGAEGYISCGGSDGTINYQTCQDSNPATKDDKGGCSAISPDVCTPAKVDSVNGGFNGGACVKYTKAGSASGAGFINNTTQLNTPLAVLNQLGPDGLPCTNDDTEQQAPPSSLGLTTGSAQTEVLNFGTGTDTQTNGPVSGHVFACGNIQSSNLTGGVIAGAFPTVSQSVTNDAVVTFHIGCQ